MRTKLVIQPGGVLFCERDDIQLSGWVVLPPTWETRIDGISGHWAELTDEDLQQARREYAEWQAKCPTAAKEKVEAADYESLVDQLPRLRCRISNDVFRAMYASDDPQGHPKLFRRF